MIKVEWNQLEIKGKSSGETSVLCPNCSHTRTKNKDKCMRVNVSKGLGFCHHCGAISVKEDKPLIDIKPYTIPKQEWTNYTNMSDKAVKYCNSRGISQSTIKELKVSEEQYFQPALGKKVNNIVFNYFEGDTLINKKFRSADKHFTQLSNTKPMFYNINSVINSDVVYIVEGEFDVLAMHEAGFKNTISIPNGANDHDDFWINAEIYLKGVKKFYIATDRDDKGEIVAEKIAQRLGRYRCERILFKTKDANGDLMSGGVDLVKKSVSESKRYPLLGTFTIDDLAQDIIDLHQNGLPKIYFPKHYSFGNLKDIFSVMRGHLVTATGIPSHGKSNFVEWYIMNLVNDYDMKASFYSPEHHPMALHQTTFIEKFYGKNFFLDNPGLPRISLREIDEYRKWANEKIYITTQDAEQYPTWNWLLDKFKEQLYMFGVDIFVIDAFNKVEFDDTKANDLSNIRKVLTKLTNFCQVNNVIVFLVAHPRKMTKREDGQYESPSLYSISGSADFRNMTHDGFSIYRYFKDINEGDRIIMKDQVEFQVEKVKMKFQGKMMESEIFNYHLPSGRYYSSSLSQVPKYILSERIGSVEENRIKIEHDELPF